MKTKLDSGFVVSCPNQKHCRVFELQMVKKINAKINGFSLNSPTSFGRGYLKGLEDAIRIIKEVGK